MATFRFNAWPQNVVRREVEIYRLADDDAEELVRKVRVSPPEMNLDLGTFAEGERIRLKIFSVERPNRRNTTPVIRNYTIPDNTDVADDAAGTLVVEGQDVPEDTGQPPDQQGQGGAPTAPEGPPAPAPTPAPGNPAPAPETAPAPTAPAPENPPA
jgi:hypothetical protein